MLQEFKPPYDATVVEKLSEMGGIPCLKTNMDEFGMGSASSNSIHGAVKSPIMINGQALSPGGSSGGAAAVVAQAI